MASEPIRVQEPIRFGEDFEVDASARRLRRGGHVLKLERIPLEILVLLLEHWGEIVTRDEIVAKVWGKGVFLDTDNSTRGAIRKIRQVLKDDPEHPRFIQTVTGHGYRFIAPVISPEEENRADASKGQPSAVPEGMPIHRHVHDKRGSVYALISELDTWLQGRRLRLEEEEKERGAETPVDAEGDHGPRGTPRSRRWLVLGGVAVLALLAVTYVMTRSRGGDATRPKIKSLAVLPLKNLSGDPSQEYFADGMTESVIGRLSMISGLRVISRTSVMGFKDTRMSAPEIARTLHVDAIVEGSVIREGNRVRVTVQLIRGATDEHIWAEEYRREYRSILALQDEVARTIAQQIKITMTPQERVDLAGTRTVDPEAHENYLKGRYYSNQRTEEALKRSIAYFQQAITKDPSYALAYSGLADAYALLGFRGRFPSKDALSRAKAAALKAVELDDTLAEPHASLAFIAETHEWDWATAEREFKRALELDPGYARAHHWYAGYLMYVGRFEEGIAEARRARDLDPVSLPVNNALAGRLLVAGRVDEAMEQLQKTLEMNPHFGPAHQTLGWAYLNKGKHEEAIQEFQKAVELSGTDDLDLVLDLGFAYAAVGNQEEARKILAKLKKQHEQGLVPSGSIAILYGALGELDEAFAWLEKAYEERDPELTYLKVPTRRFEPLRHDPRFRKLLLRMGLAD